MTNLTSALCFSAFDSVDEWCLGMGGLEFGENLCVLGLGKCQCRRLQVAKTHHVLGSFSRALRALAVAKACPSLWGLKQDDSIVRNDARQALH